MPDRRKRHLWVVSLGGMTRTSVETLPIVRPTLLELPPALATCCYTRTLTAREKNRRQKVNN